MNPGGERLDVAQQPHRDLRAGLPGGPNTPPQGREIDDALTVDREDRVAGMNIGLLRRAPRGDAGDDDALVALGSVEAEPWTGRPVRPSIGQEIVENRRQE